MQQLNNLGVGLTLDDFGTGYSSRNYLRKFPFHKIKIDQSFICDLGDEREVRVIIGAVASLDKTVVAEGIETERADKAGDVVATKVRAIYLAAQSTGRQCAAGNAYHVGADGRPVSGPSDIFSALNNRSRHRAAMGWRPEVIAGTRASHYPCPLMIRTICAG
jgi:predicted signal transduction protein with EAL and GGDEF domain